MDECFVNIIKKQVAGDDLLGFKCECVKSAVIVVWQIIVVGVVNSSLLGFLGRGYELTSLTVKKAAFLESQYF